MLKIATGVFKNNALTIEEKLDLNEGEKVKLIIIDNKERTKKSFLVFADKYNFTIPENYKFNRDELYDR